MSSYSLATVDSLDTLLAVLLQPPVQCLLDACVRDLSAGEAGQVMVLTDSGVLWYLDLEKSVSLKIGQSNTREVRQMTEHEGVLLNLDGDTLRLGTVSGTYQMLQETFMPQCSPTVYLLLDPFLLVGLEGTPLRIYSQHSLVGNVDLGAG